MPNVPQSIIIPTLRTEAELQNQIEEIKRTTVGEYELIVTGQPVSAAKNRNIGLNKAKYDLIIMLDDDILGLSPGWNDTLTLPLRTEKFNAVMTSARLMNMDGSPAMMSEFNPDLVSPYVTNHYLPSACIAFWKDETRFDEEFIGSGWEDTHFCFLLTKKYPEKKFYVVNLCRVVHLNEMKNQGRTTWEATDDDALRGKTWNFNKNLYLEKIGHPDPVKKPDFPIIEKRISLCMIVKNEEKFLAPCLDSVQDLVDEIIVVDTGSTDTTKLIASTYPKVILHDFEWTGSFADARNYSIDQATGDWILVLDADEVIDKGTREDLQYMANVPSPFPVIFNVHIDNPISETGEMIQHYMARFFQRDPQIQYQGTIHESIRHLGGVKIIQSVTDKLCLLHNGYMKEMIADRDKSNRNIALLEEEVRKCPQHLFYLYHLAISYRVAGRDKDAALTFGKWQKGIMGKDGQPTDKTFDVSLGFGNYLSVLMKLQRHREALALGNQMDRLCNHNPDFNLNYALLLTNGGNHARAWEVVQRCLNAKGQRFSALMFDKNTIGWKAYAVAGNIQKEMGNLPKAVELWKEALKMNQKNVEVYKVLVSSLPQMKLFDEAVKLAEKMFLAFPETLQDENLRLAYGNSLFNSGKVVEALEIFASTSLYDSSIDQLVQQLVMHGDFNKLYLVQQFMKDHKSKK